MNTEDNLQTLREIYTRIKDPRIRAKIKDMAEHFKGLPEYIPEKNDSKLFTDIKETLL